MKIIYITPYYKPAWYYGGPSKCIAEQAEYLAATFDVQIDVITLNANGAEKLYPTTLPHVIDVNGVTVHYLPRAQSRIGNLYFHSPVLSKYLLQFKEYDLVHVHTLFNAFSQQGMRFAIRHSIPFGVSVHGMLDQFSLSRSARVKKIHRWLYEDRLLPKAAFVHFTTKNEVKNAISPSKTRPVIIPIGFNFSPWTDYKQGRTGHALQIIYLSRINRKKGLDLLIKALSKLDVSIKSNVFLDVYGDDDDNCLPELSNLVKTEGLESQVVFKGKLNPQDRDYTLQQYDLMALTSRQENFGLVVAEALDQKVPVLVSDKVNLYDKILENKCGWVCQLSRADICKKITEIYRTPRHTFLIIGQKGHEMVRSEYGFEKVGIEYWKLYQTVLSNAKN